MVVFPSTSNQGGKHAKTMYDGVPANGTGTQKTNTMYEKDGNLCWYNWNRCITSILKMQ